MNNAASRMRALAIALALPVGGIAISYASVIDGPLRTRVAEAQTKLAKLSDTIKNRTAQHKQNLQQLEQTQQQQRELAKLVTAVPPVDVDQAALPTESTKVREDSEIARLSTLLALFDRHHVECLASQPGDLPGDEKTSTKENDRRVMRVTLQGCFADMHGALEEMQSALNCVSIVSLEMEASPAGETFHRWILILLL